MPDVRPLAAADAEAVYEVQVEAFRELDRRLGLGYPDAPADPEPGRRRIRHLAGTDPGGAWVAVDDGGSVTGAALALVREGLWGLSLLVVRPDRQSSGVGSELMRRSLAYGDDARGGVILATEDPRALRTYWRAGFTPRPVFDASGPVRHRPAMPQGVRTGSWPEDRDVVDAAGRFVRGASHALDLPNYLRAANELLVHEAGGFAVHDGTQVRMLAALDERAATDLLRAVLHRAKEGEDVHVDFLDARQDWAIDVVLEAGLDLRGSGGTFVRGDVGPMRPYLPSGAYL